MRTIEDQIAAAARESVKRVLPLPETARAICRVERRMAGGMRRGGRGADGSRDDVAVDNLRGLNNFSPLNFLQTANPGADPGVATGWGFAVFCRPEMFVSGSRVIASMYAFPTGGYELRYDDTTGFRFLAGNTAGPSPGPLLASSEWGRLQLVVAYYDGANFQIWLGRRLAATLAATFVPVPSSLTFGARAGAPPTLSATGMGFFGGFQFRGTPTQAQFEALYDATRVRGDVPTAFAGATVTHRWSIKDELSGIAVPTGRKTYGARGFGAGGASYSTATGTATGIVGSASGFYAQGYLKPTAVVSSNYFLARWSGTNGFLLEQANTVLQCRMGNGSASITSPTFTIGTAANTMMLMTAVWDQPALKLRLYIDGIEQGTGSAMAAYAPLSSADKMYIGRYSGSGGSDGGPSLFQVAGGNTIPSAAALLAQANATRAAGKLVPLSADHVYDIDADVKASGNLTALPNTVTDRAGSDNLTISGALSLVSDSTIFAPAQLTDRVTGAAGDAALTNGSVTLVEVDPTIDGRRTLGAQGFGAANYYVASATGIRGTAAGLSLSIVVRPDVTPTGSHHVISCYNAASTAGFSLAEIAGAYRLDTFTAGAAFNPGCGTWTLTAADLGRFALVTIVYTGTAWRFYVNGVQLGTDVVNTFLPNTTGPMYVGKNASTAEPYDSSIFAVCGASGAAKVWTPAEVQQQCADWVATGRLAGVPGKVDGCWDFTSAILATGVDAAPAVIPDTVGTDNLMRLGPDIAIGGKQGLKLFSTGAGQITNGLTTAAGGGIAGTSTALTVRCLLSPIALHAANCHIVTKYAGGLGYDICRLGTVGTNALIAFVVNGTQSAVTYAIQTADLSTLLHVALTCDGTNARLYVNGVLIATQATAYTPATATPMLVGARSDAIGPANDNAFFAVGGGSYVATQAELAADAAASIAAGQLAAIPGRTDDRRYNYAQDAIDQATSLPGQCVDRMGTTDRMVRAGSGLTLAQSTVRTYAWEATPIIKSGATSAANRWESAVSLANAGDPVGFFVAPVVRCKGATSGRFIANAAGGPQGWNWNGNAGALLQFSVVDGSGANKSAPTISVSPDSKIRPVLGVLDIPSSLVRSYANRAQVSTGVSCTGYTMTSLASIGMTIGAFYGGSSGNTDWEVIGLVMGYGVPTFAEFRAWEDACIAAEDIVALGGAKSAHMYSVKRGMSGTTLLDLIGTAHLPAVSAPSTVDIYSRAFAA